MPADLHYARGACDLLTALFKRLPKPSKEARGTSDRENREKHKVFLRFPVSQGKKIMPLIFLGPRGGGPGGHSHRH